MRIVTFFIFLLFPFSLISQQRVWIDTDILMGKFGSDVDDGLALIMALQDTNLSIQGISFVQNSKYSQKVTEKLLRWYAPEADIPRFSGANGKGDVGKETEASKALIAALEKGPLTLLALGPLTSVASVLQKRPDLAQNISRIGICAGRRPGMSFSPGTGKVKFSDYNFDLDPTSAQVVLNAQIPILLAGYDCSDSLFLSMEDVKHLKTSRSKGDRWVYRQLKDWLWIWRNFFDTKKGFIPFDCATLGATIYPTEFEIKHNEQGYVEVAKNDTKNQIRSETKPYLYAEADHEGVPVTYCEHSKRVFKTRLLKALAHPDYD